MLARGKKDLIALPGALTDRTTQAIHCVYGLHTQAIHCVNSRYPVGHDPRGTAVGVCSPSYPHCGFI